MNEGSLILSVNKPVGWTSFDVVAKLRNALKWKSVGHAGTLDPPADGVLIILCGGATARSSEFMALPKEYVARIRFGITTATDDLDGEIISSAGISDWSEDRIRTALLSQTGTIMQIPPQVSAVKVGGKRAYALSRKGHAVSLAERAVTVHSLDVLSMECPDVVLRMKCSRGTYVRSLARDVGAILGWGGTLARLTRSAVGDYRVESSLGLNNVLERAAEFKSH